ncbi:hypothetical protein FIBSPDRAFT_903123 [Athelia psychrophila]|uniref:Uncharacterized protein n=1 Tax=Athelia psychrophila TaxID=1759441 RepID=A0A167WE24_9AGAM|nr:hypothetical protein FIBSPDRAFT_903123 [Fibularhizoctonia sp. CBS 109695]
MSCRTSTGRKGVRGWALPPVIITNVGPGKMLVGLLVSYSSGAKPLTSLNMAVCTRADPLTVEEGVKLGVEDIIRISAARQAYGCAKARYETKHLSGDLGDIFKLEKPFEEPSVGSMDIEENAINFLEDQVVAVQAEFTAFPAPAKRLCVMFAASYGFDCTTSSSYANGHYIQNPCAGCRAPGESDEQRLKREDKEDKERRLKDLKEKRDVGQRDLVEKQERMSLFR